MTVVERLTFRTMEDVAEFLNEEFPAGKIYDGNPRRGVRAESTEFTSVDVANYVKRGWIPPKYIRASLSKEGPEGEKPSIVVSLHEELPSKRKQTTTV